MQIYGDLLTSLRQLTSQQNFVAMLVKEDISYAY